jgi:hypothetical protein
MWWNANLKGIVRGLIQQLNALDLNQFERALSKMMNGSFGGT